MRGWINKSIPHHGLYEGNLRMTWDRIYVITMLTGKITGHSGCMGMQGDGNDGEFH